jgi:Ca-activated chloride channel family protein
LKFRFNKSTWIIVGMILPSCAYATTWEAYTFNRDGVKKLSEKSYFPAYQTFLKALESDPMNPYVQLNLALALEASEDFERAEKAYRGVLKLVGQDSALKFQALFNLAGVQAKQKKIDEALATYQDALELNPDSIEVKTNIELLWQGGGGGGEGDKQDQKQDSKDGKGGGEPQKPDEGDGKKEKQKPQPRPADAEMERRILDEIKNQEQAIRAKDYEKGAKDAPRAKDW